MVARELREDLCRLGADSAPAVLQVTVETQRLAMPQVHNLELTQVRRRVMLEVRGRASRVARKADMTDTSRLQEALHRTMASRLALELVVYNRLGVTLRLLVHLLLPILRSDIGCSQSRMPP